MTPAEYAIYVGARIRQLRRDRGLSQQALADRAGMYRPNLSRIEHGYRGAGTLPRLDTLMVIADALGCEPWHLIWRPSADMPEAAE